jgi:DNA helicase-2/ATP-dependent DNA helicase PcrA
MENLECSYTDQRFRFGNLLPMTPSRFLTTISEDLYTFMDRSGFAMREERRQPRTAFVPVREPKIVDMDRKPVSDDPLPQYHQDDFSQDSVQYRMGQHVSHKLYGKGKITGISGFGQDMHLTVLFNDGTRKKLMAKFAKFE